MQHQFLTPTPVINWEALGFSDNPFQTRPIVEGTLDLYTGNQQKLRLCQAALQSNNSVLLIEGERGVGTTSFANYLRFLLRHAKTHFTPIAEIRFEPSWNSEKLMAAIIASIVSSLEISHLPQLAKNTKFKEARAAVKRVTETYRSFGASAFGFGANYELTPDSSEPPVISTQALAVHLENLALITKELGFKYGLLLQIDNLDIESAASKIHFKTIFNILRDYLQIPYTNWLLVGSASLRKFLAQHVSRVEEIISLAIEIPNLSEKEYLKLIQNRINHYKTKTSVKLPMEEEVWRYLYQVTNGRVRYIFGLVSNIFYQFQPGILTDVITLELAKPLIKNYALERLTQFRLSKNEQIVLAEVSKHDKISAQELAEILHKTPSYLSTILKTLYNYKLIDCHQDGARKYYFSCTDALVAYSAS